MPQFAAPAADAGAFCEGSSDVGAGPQEDQASCYKQRKQRSADEKEVARAPGEQCRGEVFIGRPIFIAVLVL